VRNEPEPSLKPAAFERIRDQLLAEVDILITSEGQPTPKLSPSLPAPIVIIMIGVVIIVALLLLLARQEPAEVAPPQSTSPTVPDTSQTPFVQEATDSATDIVTPTPLLTLNSTPIPAATQTSSEAVLVIEGPVSAINANTVTIFGTNIWIDPNNPILADIKVGDELNVVGNIEFQNNVMIVVAVNITFVNNLVPTANPAVPLPPNCKVTKGGHVKCSKKNR